MPSKINKSSARGAFPQSDFSTNPLTQVRVLFNVFVKTLFAARPKNNLHWNAEDSLSEIVISDEHPIDSLAFGVRPCITFTRGAVQFFSLGADDMLTFDFETGKKTKSVLIPGMMSINCCSRNDAESENIAFWVASHIWLLREKLMGTNGFFEIGRQPTVSAPSSAEGIIAGDSGREYYCTTVTIPFQFPLTSSFTPLNREVLQGIALSVHTTMRSLQCAGQNNGPAASVNGDVPVNFRYNPPGPYLPGAVDAYGRSPDPGGTAEAPVVTQPHPLNPAQQVRVRVVRPFRPALRAPIGGGPSIPIAEHDCVESNSFPPFRTKV